MYRYIEAIVGMRLAVPLAALVYTLMALAILYCAFEPAGEFRYLEL